LTALDLSSAADEFKNELLNKMRFLCCSHWCELIAVLNVSKLYWWIRWSTDKGAVLWK